MFEKYVQLGKSPNPKKSRCLIFGMKVSLKSKNLFLSLYAIWLKQKLCSAKTFEAEYFGSSC